MLNKYDRFAQFDESAREVLQRAQEEARLLQQDAIGTEHILLGLMPNSRVRPIFSKPQVTDSTRKYLIIDLATVRATTEQVIGRGKVTLSQELDLTAEAQQALVVAEEEAQRWNRGYIGVRQLLLGLISTPDSHANQVLQSLGIDLERVRRSVGPQPFPATADEITLWGRLTERARRVISLAQEEARDQQYDNANTGNLLLGFMREKGGVASQVLTNAGLELNTVRQIIESLVGRGDYIVLGEIELTPRIKKYIKLAGDEALFLGQDAIDPEYVLLALVQDTEGVAIGVLESLGVQRELIRTEILRMLSNRATGNAEN